MRHHTPITDSDVRADAAARLGVDETALEISRHDQTFSSTACGFPGMGGAAMTDAEVIVAHAGAQGACVYVAGRLCYLVREPNETFRLDLRQRGLLPAYAYTGQYDRASQPPAETFRVKESTKEPTNLERAIDRVYDRARPGYGIKREAKTATVVRASDNELICLVVPVENGSRSPEFQFTEAAKPYRFEGRFPRIGDQ